MLYRSEDRRARRSRRLLKEGLLELMGEKRFSEISVRDITDRMDLNRGTFYLHYPDTQTLLESLEGDLLGDVQHMIDEHAQEAAVGSLKPIFEPILDYIVENRELCYTLFANNANSNFIGRIHAMISRNGAALLRSWSLNAPEDRLEYLLSFLAYGLIGLIKEWFSTGMKLPKAELLAMADGLSAAAAGQFFQ